MADWPLSYDDLEPFYAEAERSIGVAGDGRGQPLRGVAVGPLPHAVGGAHVRGACCSSAAAEALGLHPYAAPTAANSVPYDGRPACNNCGFCAFFGCPIHAKGDPVALLHARHGLGERRAAVGDLRVAGAHRRAPGHRGRGDRARRVDARASTPATWSWPPVPSRRRACCCCRGSTTRSWAGNFMVHFQTFVIGILPERVHGHKGRAVTHVHDDAMIVDDAARGRGRPKPGCRGSAAAWSSTAGPACRSWRPRSTRGGRSTSRSCAASPHARPHVGLHHAGRGPAPAHQPRGPRPHRARRARVPRGPRHLPAPSPRDRGLGPPRPAPGARARGHGRRRGR